MYSVFIMMKTLSFVNAKFIIESIDCAMQICMWYFHANNAWMYPVYINKQYIKIT